MNLKEAEKRLQKLRHLIDEERYRIHVLNEENLSEAALDALKKELTDLETEFPQLITADSPSQRVAGGILDGFIKAPHLDDQSQPSPMHSLSDVFSFEELEAWEERLASFLEKQDKKPNTTYYVDPKMDGIALELIYGFI